VSPSGLTWYIFTPKLPIFVHFVRRWNWNFWYLSKPFGLWYYAYFLTFLVFAIFSPIWSIASWKIWQPWHLFLLHLFYILSFSFLPFSSVLVQHGACFFITSIPLLTTVLPWQPFVYEGSWFEAGWPEVVFEKIAQWPRKIDKKSLNLGPRLLLNKPKAWARMGLYFEVGPRTWGIFSKSQKFSGPTQSY
jgi:hypothetical protein